MSEIIYAVKWVYWRPKIFYGSVLVSGSLVLCGNILITGMWIRWQITMPISPWLMQMSTLMTTWLSGFPLFRDNTESKCQLSNDYLDVRVSLAHWMQMFLTFVVQAETFGTKLINEDEFYDLIKNTPGKKSSYETAAEQPPSKKTKTSVSEPPQAMPSKPKMPLESPGSSQGEVVGSQKSGGSPDTRTTSAPSVKGKVKHHSEKLLTNWRGR